MKYLVVIFAICLSTVLVTGQFLDNYFQGFGGGSSRNRFGLHSLRPDFDSSPYSGGFSSQRDARQDRGPVVFPPSPPDALEETSGVIVGASGYGFVPPNQPQYRSYSHYY